MKAFESKVASFIDQHRLFPPHASLAVGVSGGPDSTALLAVLCALRGPLELNLLAVHVNHGIRGAAADADAAFVRDLCRARQVPFVLKQVDVPKLARDRRESVETAGREARRQVFAAAAAENGCDFVALAHHLDDQAETVLMRLARGTGPAGACGMRPKAGIFVRPFLGVPKREILAYLKEKDIPYRVDATNTDVTYTRNRIRQEVLPALEAAHPGASAHIADFAARLAPLADAASARVEAVLDTLLHADRFGRYFFEIKALAAQDAFMRTALLRRALFLAGGSAVDVESRHTEIILSRLAQDGKPSWDLAMGHSVTVRRRYDRLIFEAASQALRAFSGRYPITREQVFADVPDGVFITVSDGQNLSNFSQNAAQIALDCAKIKLDITLRRREAGDYVIIRGKKRSLKRFLIDRKIDRDVRDAVPVAAAGNRIVWMPGIFADRVFLADEKTRRVRTIRLEKQDD